MRRLMAVALLAFSPACSLAGWGGDNNFLNPGGLGLGDCAFSGEGKGRALTGLQIGFLDVSGTMTTSYTAEAKWKAGAFNGAGCVAPKSVHSKIVATMVTRSNADHNGFDPGYMSMGFSDKQGKEINDHGDDYPDHVATHETKDTNKDGYISGGEGWFNGTFSNCATQFTTLVDNLSGIPAANLHMDTPRCLRGADPVADGFEALDTDASYDPAFTGGFAFVHKGSEGPSSILSRLPIATQIAFLNSINVGQPQEVANPVNNPNLNAAAQAISPKVRISSVSINGATYRPTGAMVQLMGMRNMTVDLHSPGMKALVGWIADSMQAALNRGDTTLRGSFTFNDAVTIGLDQIPAGSVKFAPISQQAIDNFRRLATK